jgi:hypothetical protein
MNPFEFLLNWQKSLLKINPFEYFYQINKWWAETFLEVRSLRNCHNINVVRLDRIEKALRAEGIG